MSSKTNRAKCAQRETGNKSTRAKRRLKLTKPVVATGPAPSRVGSKLATLTALLQRREGATIEQLAKATGWQRHSIRGAMSGALKKKMGLIIASSKADGVRTYRIGAA